MRIIDIANYAYVVTDDDKKTAFYTVIFTPDRDTLSTDMFHLSITCHHADAPSIMIERERDTKIDIDHGIVVVQGRFSSIIMRQQEDQDND